MCGRFGLWAGKKQVKKHFQLQYQPSFDPRYNIAPSQEILVIGQDEDKNRKSARFIWGLVPHWAKDSRTSYKMINARAETLWKKPAYKSAAKRRRCLVPASCFFEWKRKDKGAKQPYCIRPGQEELIAFAGIWEYWEDKEAGQSIYSCAIVTTAANDAVSNLHDRMPVIVLPSDYDLWLDNNIQESGELKELLKQCASDLLEIYPVSKEVNNPKNDNESVVFHSGGINEGNI